MKILFVACYSPFINNSAAIEALQYLNKLNEIKENEIYLLTVKFPENSIYYDEKLSKLLHKDIKVFQINGGTLFNKLVPKKSNSIVSEDINKNNKIKILRKIKNAVIIPDMYYNWAIKASKAGIDIIKKENIDVIFSMHEPPSSHLCAYKIKKRFKDIPWITYWSDPWLKDSTKENSIFIKKIIEKRMETNVINMADRYIFVTEPNRQDYIETYKLDSRDTFIVTRGFDKTLFNKLRKREKPALLKEDKVNILYTGEIFSKLRNIKPFVEAVTNIKKKHKDLYNKMNILFFGNIDDAEAKKMLKDIDVASVEGRIPFEDALTYMLNSEILLLFGNKNSKQIPAKIYEYFGAEGKILAIYGDENDPIKSLVENNNKCICSNNNVNEIESCLIKLLKTEKRELLTEPNYKYEWDNIIDRLNKILEV